MKKLLSLLGAVTLTASASTSVIACSDPGTNPGGGNENLPDTDFILEKKSVDMDSKTPASIKITNYDILNSNSMPSEFIISEPDVIQVTVSITDKSLIITPKNVTKSIDGIKVTAKSRYGTSIDFTVNVENLGNQTEMNLEKTELTMGNSRQSSIKITNYSTLLEEGKPKDFIFSEEGYASAEMDWANGEIIITSENKVVDDLTLTIIANNNKQSVVSISIEQQPIVLNEGDYITNVIAGNMNEYGEIDSSISVGKEGFVITKKSVLSSFNVMNNLNLSEEDVIIREEPESGFNGIGATYYIMANENSQNVEGVVELTLNQGIDPNQYFKNKNLGEIRIFEGAFNNLNEVLNSKDVISLGAIVFEAVGDRNKQLEYVKANFVDKGGEAGQAIMRNAKTTATTFQITGMPDLGGIFVKDQNVEFTFNFVKEDRITFYEALPENKYITFDKALEEDKTPEGQIKLRTEVYNQLNKEFKDIISLEHFLKFSKVLYNSKRSSINATQVTKIDIIPGSPLMYGHDGAAYIGYINNPGGLAGASGGGNLEKYEESGKLDIKYTTGMGWIDPLFDPGAALNGQFYQGHVVLNPVDLNSKYVTAPINDFTLSKAEGTKQISFEIANLSPEDNVEVVSSRDGIISVSDLVATDTSKFTANINYLKGQGLLGSPNITIKVNGQTISDFIVKTA